MGRKKSKKRWMWTPENVLWCINWLHFCGYPLNAASIDRLFSMLHVKGIEFFGNWDNSLLAEGLNPKQFRKKCPKRSDEDIIREFREIKSRNEPLSDIHIKTNYESLHNAAKNSQGVGPLVEQAGFDYIQESLHVSTKTRLRNLSAAKIKHIAEKYSTQERSQDEKSGQTSTNSC